MWPYACFVSYGNAVSVGVILSAPVEIACYDTEEVVCTYRYGIRLYTLHGSGLSDLGSVKGSIFKPEFCCYTGMSCFVLNFTCD